MAQATKKKPKNPRCRISRLSHRQFRKLVEAFAYDRTAKDAASEAKVSKPTAESIYARLRQRLSEHPLVTFIPGPERSPAMMTVVNRKHAGIQAGEFRLHEMEMLTRILNAQHFAGFERLSAADPAHVARAIRLMKMKFADGRPRYNIYEKLEAQPGDESPGTRPFDPLSYELSSAILVNEMKADPREAHFRYIWKLLLKHPL